MSYSNMNSKYRNVEDTLVSKNALAELDLPDITSKIRVASGTLNLTNLITGNLTAAFLGPNGQPLMVPRGAYLDKVTIRYDGSCLAAGTDTPITGAGTLSVGATSLTNGVLGTPAPFTGMTAVNAASINAGATYNGVYSNNYNIDTRVITGTVSVTGGLTGTTVSGTLVPGVARINVHYVLP